MTKYIGASPLTHSPLNQSYNYKLGRPRQPSPLFLWWQVGLEAAYSLLSYAETCWEYTQGGENYSIFDCSLPLNLASPFSLDMIWCPFPPWTYHFAGFTMMMRMFGSTSRREERILRCWAMYNFFLSFFLSLILFVCMLVGWSVCQQAYAKTNFLWKVGTRAMKEAIQFSCGFVHKGPDSGLFFNRFRSRC